MRKTKTPQAEDLERVHNRDNFQTPNYAVDLLVPFLTEVRFASQSMRFRIWECASGLGKIVNRLSAWKFDAVGTDLQFPPYVNFLKDRPPTEFDCIVTNTPFSLKRKFYERCRFYDVPFALLIPADYSGWIIQAVRDGCEKIIPTRRIDFITPNILQRIWEGEIFELVRKEDKLDLTLGQFKESCPVSWNRYVAKYGNRNKFDNIYDTPFELLRKYSSSDFHSMWLTWGFNIGCTETFVELTNEMKNNI